MSRLLRLVPIVVASVSAPACAEDLPDSVFAAFDASVFEYGGTHLPYRLLSPPGATPSRTRPLLVFLHGYGERGDDNRSQLRNGGRLFASDEFRQRYEPYVLMPQCPALGTPGTREEVVWNEPPQDGLRITIDPEQPAQPPLEAVRVLVGSLVDELPIDPDRVYLGGVSMGGFATWDLATREPNRWAAVLPICGSGDPSHGRRLAELPTWAIHGRLDDVVPVARSREMISAIKAAGGRPVYSEYEHVGHNAWENVFESRHLWDWLFSKSR